MANDLIGRLRASTLAHYAAMRAQERERPDWGVRGRCTAVNEPTIPLRGTVVPGEGWAYSQCAVCDYWHDGQPGYLLPGHDRVWRRSDGVMMP